MFPWVPWLVWGSDSERRQVRRLAREVWEKDETWRKLGCTVLSERAVAAVRTAAQELKPSLVEAGQAAEGFLRRNVWSRIERALHQEREGAKRKRADNDDDDDNHVVGGGHPRVAPRGRFRGPRWPAQFRGAVVSSDDDEEEEEDEPESAKQGGQKDNKSASSPAVTAPTGGAATAATTAAAAPTAGSVAARAAAAQPTPRRGPVATAARTQEGSLVRCPPPLPVAARAVAAAQQPTLRSEPVATAARTQEGSLVRCPPPRSEADHQDDPHEVEEEEEQGSDDEDDDEAAHAGAAATNNMYDPSQAWPNERLACCTERQIEYKLRSGMFDHHQEDDLDLPSRYLTNWVLFQRRSGPTGGRPRWYPHPEFPTNDNLTTYGLVGYLVAPDRTHIKVRLNALDSFTFDQCPARRGWWVTPYDGNSKVAALYRLLDPEPSAGPPRFGPHLEQRALLTVLSSLLKGLLPIGNDEGKRHGDVRAHSEPLREMSLDPFVDQALAEGIDVLPVLRLFEDKLKAFLKYRFLYKRTKWSRPVPLETHPLGEVSSADLLKVTVALERVYVLLPWGVPADFSASHKRKGSPSPTTDVAAPKKMRFENGPSASSSVPEVSDHTSSSAGSSQDSVSRESSDRPSEVSTTPPPQGLLSSQEFKDLFLDDDDDDELEELEEHKEIRFGGDRTEHQYGRILPNAAESFFDLLSLKRNDAFVDLGSGIGSLVLQAAYTVGCPSRGIEIVRSRHLAALDLVEHTLERTRDLEGIHPGSVEFVNEDLISQEAVWLTNDAIRDADANGGYIKAFVNNYEGIMGDRSPGARFGMSPENYIAGQFASWPPGSQLVTISPLLCLGLPMTQAVVELKKHNLIAGKDSHSSFFRLDESYVGPQNEVASWSHHSGCTKAVRAYRYTRLEQDLVGTKGSSTDSGRVSRHRRSCASSSAVFLCCNPDCPVAQSGTPVPATRLDDDGLPLVNTCSCAYQPKALRHRRESVP